MSFQKNLEPFRLAREAANFISESLGLAHHDVALTLGSGWAKAADLLGETRAILSASEVPGFSSAKIPGHSGTIQSIKLSNEKNGQIPKIQKSILFLESVHLFGFVFAHVFSCVELKSAKF